MQTNKNSLVWQAPEYKHYEKNLGWYVTFISVSVLVCAMFFLVLNDVFGAITLAVIAVVVGIFSQRKPDTVNVEISEHGVKVGGIAFPFKHIKSFWVVHNQNHQTVNFETTTLVNNILVVELENQDPAEVRNFLLNHLPEHENVRETTIQRFIHWIKF